MNKFNFKALLPFLWLACAPLASHASVSVGISISVAPPELPVYVQPPIPEPGYIWTPGYWAWGPDGYYWVPGTWVSPPQVGFLWTPGYWGWRSGFYVWNAGYWGPHVGFYGGINYGYGYGGVGYEGGYWRGNRLYYNRSVNNINNVHITNVYNTTIINGPNPNRVSYNGGNGIRREPSGMELTALRERHEGYTRDQRRHEEGAARDRSFLASVNHGRPEIAVTQRPAAFKPAPSSGGFNTNRGDRPNRGDVGRGPANRGPADRGAADRGPADRGAGYSAPPGTQTQVRRDRPPGGVRDNVNDPRVDRVERADRMPRNDRPPATNGAQNRFPSNSHPSNRDPSQQPQRPQVRGPESRGPARDEVRQPPVRAPESRGPAREAPPRMQPQGQPRMQPQAQPRAQPQAQPRPQAQPERRGPEGRPEGRGEGRDRR